AQAKCKVAELTSDIETVPEDNDIDGQRPTKRVRRSPQRYDELDFQQDDDADCSAYDDDENQQGQVVNRMLALPPPMPKIST
ncbi:hypothetical protein LSH36_488g06001, partial [Paralvinella palmiformis]